MAAGGATAMRDHEALAEIELCGELMIAASAAVGERLSLDSIDAVLRVGEKGERRELGEEGEREQREQRDQE